MAYSPSPCWGLGAILICEYKGVGVAVQVMHAVGSDADADGVGAVGFWRDEDAVGGVVDLGEVAGGAVAEHDRAQIKIGDGFAEAEGKEDRAVGIAGGDAVGDDQGLVS